MLIFRMHTILDEFINVLGRNVFVFVKVYYVPCVATPGDIRDNDECTIRVSRTVTHCNHKLRTILIL